MLNIGSDWFAFVMATEDFGEKQIAFFPLLTKQNENKNGIKAIFQNENHNLANLR